MLVSGDGRPWNAKALSLKLPVLLPPVPGAGVRFVWFRYWLVR